MAVACMPYAMAMTPDLASIWIDTSTTTWVLDGQQLEKAGKPPTQSFLGSQNQSFTWNKQLAKLWSFVLVEAALKSIPNGHAQRQFATEGCTQYASVELRLNQPNGGLRKGNIVSLTHQRR